MFKKAVASAVIFLSVLAAAYAYYFLFTPRGAETLSGIILARAGMDKDLLKGRISGNLVSGISLEDLDISNIKGLPPNSLLKVGKLRFSLRSFFVRDLACSLSDASVTLPTADVLRFYGTYGGRKLHLNVYSDAVSLRALSLFFPQYHRLSLARGKISKFEILVSGNISQPAVKGGCEVSEIDYRNINVKGVSCTFDLQAKLSGGKVSLNGAAVISGGVLKSGGTLVKIEPGRLVFSGNPYNPGLDIKGISLIKDTKISIFLQGTLAKPEFNLVSVPQFSQERLLMMLATSRSWESADSFSEQNKLPAGVVKDFVDYFFLGGSAQKLQDTLGIDIALDYQSQEKGVELKKSLAGPASAVFGLKQTQKDQEAPVTTKKVGLEYKVTDNISVEGSQTVSTSGEKKIDPEKQEKQVEIRYKSAF